VSEETTDAAPKAADQAPPAEVDPAPAPERSTEQSDEKSSEQSAEKAAERPTEPVTAPAAPRPPTARKIVFRVPTASYVAVVFLAVCASFVAAAAPYYTVVYLIPLGVLVWTARTRTEVDADRLVVRRVLTRTVIPWSRVASLRLVDKGWIRAVRTDGGEIALPSVRTRHLPALALISGGRLTDPTDPASGPDDQP
jgi:hypothetical protein